MVMKNKFILTILVVSFLIGMNPVFAKPLDYTPVIAVFPLQNATGRPDMDWLSIGLQESLTVDLWYVSALNTKSLAVFPMAIKESCPAMELDCVIKMKASNWHAIATKSGLDWFLSGNYQMEGEAVLVNLHYYMSPDWVLKREMTFKTSLSGLLRESSKQLIHILNTNSIACEVSP